MHYDKKSVIFFIIAFLFGSIAVITYKEPEQVQAYYETGSNYITNANDKIKIFTESTKGNLENSINEFLKENIIISIDYEVYPQLLGNNYQALIHYKEKK